MAIALHAPQKLFAKDKGVANMGKKSLHDFAATKAKGLPEHVKHAPKQAPPPKINHMPSATKMKRAK